MAEKCPKCGGLGGYGMLTCPVCRGSGVAETCPRCGANPKEYPVYCCGQWTCETWRCGDGHVIQSTNCALRIVAQRDARILELEKIVDRLSVALAKEEAWRQKGGLTAGGHAEQDVDKLVNLLRKRNP